jgi:hypothetical protein
LAKFESICLGAVVSYQLLVIGELPAVVLSIWQFAPCAGKYLQTPPPVRLSARSSLALGSRFTAFCREKRKNAASGTRLGPCDDSVLIVE